MKIAIAILLLILAGCSQTTTTATNSPSLRWMDRTIYLANANSADPTRNNAIEKQKVKDALALLEQNTSLGEGYFSFIEVDESTLNTSLTSSSTSTPQSFILIWPDAVFNAYVANVVGGQIPDPNAVAVINDSDKREFFIILRASCVNSANSGASAQCSSLGVNGFNALVFRQMGLLVGLPTKDCTLFPNDIMCAMNPSVNQFSSSSQQSFFAAFNNSLETILLNSSYYSQ